MTAVHRVVAQRSARRKYAAFWVMPVVVRGHSGVKSGRRRRAALKELEREPFDRGPPMPAHSSRFT